MRIFSFDKFALHMGRYELTRSGQALPLPRVSMEILILVLERRGDLLLREEIAAAIWPGSDPADVARSINSAVNRIRSTLRDDPASPKYIQTVIGKGYRLIAKVEVVELSEPEPEAPLPLEAIPGNVEDDAPSPSVKRRSMSRWWWLVPALSLLLFALGFLLHARHVVAGNGNPSGLDLIRFTSKASEDRVTAAAISPDGRLIAYADADGMVVQANRDATTHPLRAPRVRVVNHVAWFPDGLHLVMSGEDASTGKPQLWLLAVTGDAPVLLREDARFGVPSPDGSRIAFVSGDGSAVWLAGPAGETPARWMAGSPQQTFPFVMWSQDGRNLLLERRTVSPGEDPQRPGERETKYGFTSSYLAVDVSTGKVTASIDGVRFGDACLLPGDQMLFARNEPNEYGPSSSFWRVKLNPTTDSFASEPAKVQELSNMHVQELSVAANTGALAAVFKQGQQVVYVGAFRTSGPRLDDVRRLSLDDSIAYPHGWTADASAVLYESARAGHWQIYRQQLDHHDPDAILSMNGDEELPRLGPDHSSILFAGRSSPHASYGLFRVSLEGGPPVSVDTKGPMDSFRCPLSSKLCVLRTREAEESYTYSLLDPTSGKGARLIKTPWVWAAHGDWDVSPDGSQLAMISPLSPAPEIRIVSLPSGKIRVIPVNIRSRLIALNWAAGINGWFVAAATATGSDLFYVDAEGKTTLLRQTTASTWAVPAPDGKKLAFVDQDVDSNVWLLHLNGRE
jgi:Tol biopolymer transport system component/DNA-binding winged helix-turn-helix (wHTH) protein